MDCWIIECRCCCCYAARFGVMSSGYLPLGNCCHPCWWPYWWEFLEQDWWFVGKLTLMHVLGMLLSWWFAFLEMPWWHNVAASMSGLLLFVVWCSNLHCFQLPILICFCPMQRYGLMMITGRKLYNMWTIIVTGCHIWCNASVYACYQPKGHCHATQVLRLLLACTMPCRFAFPSFLTNDA